MKCPNCNNRKFKLILDHEKEKPYFHCKECNITYDLQEDWSLKEIEYVDE